MFTLSSVSKYEQAVRHPQCLQIQYSDKAQMGGKKQLLRLLFLHPPLGGKGQATAVFAPRIGITVVYIVSRSCCFKGASV